MKAQSKIRVLVADNDIDYCFVCTSQINMFDDMVCCGVAHDGREAVQKITDTQPDVVILGVNLPIIDGIGVMECVFLKNTGVEPKFIAVSAGNHGSVADIMLKSGASYYLVKPCNIDIFASRIRMVANGALNAAEKGEMNDNNSKEMLKKTVLKHVLELGLPTKLIGFDYVQEIITELVENKNTRPTLTQIYKNVADKFDTDSRCVENAVAGVIKSAMSNKTSAMSNMLLLSNNEELNSISNGKFISLAVENFKLNIL